MARRGGWRRVGSRRRFRYEDSRGKWITDPDKIERIEALVIPPAWRDVWISPRANAKLQATGIDKAGRRQYLYHPEFRARQEQAKYDKLVRFADHLPDLRQAMSDDLEGEEFTREWTCALAVKLINLGWFRVGAERYAKQYRTFGITTLNKSHVAVRGKRVAFRYRGKHRVWVRTVIVDAELAEAMRSLVSLDGGRRLFRYRLDDGFVNLDSRKLNEYIQERMGEEFTAKDFRTWGGTLIAAVALAERDVPHTETEAKRVMAATWRSALSYRCCARGAFGRLAQPHTICVRRCIRLHESRTKKEGLELARKTVLVCDNCGKEVGEGKGATLRLTYTDARRGAKQADLCDDCSAKMPGRAAARRGRRPKSAAA